MAAATAKVDPFLRRKPRKKAGTAMTNPPLTALIDVFLFLIIFFLLSCQFHQAEGTINGDLPKTHGVVDAPSDGQPPPLKDPIYIDLALDTNKKLVIVMDHMENPVKIPSFADLYPALVAKAGTFKAAELKDQATVIIRTSQGIKDVGWGTVVNTFNDAHRAGFQQVGWAPPPSEADPSTRRNV